MRLLKIATCVYCFIGFDKRFACEKHILIYMGVVVSLYLLLSIDIPFAFTFYDGFTVVKI